MDSRAPTIDELLRLAREDIARNSLSSAEKTLEQAILMNNQVPDAFHLLGYCYSKKGKFKKAILAFQKALNLDPFHTEAAIALSSCNDVGRYRDGAAVFYQLRNGSTKQPLDSIRGSNHNLAQKHHELGLFYMRFERFQEAHHEFAKALNLEPDSPAHAIQMAKCLSKTGDKLAATEFLRKTLDRCPRSIEARVQLGIVLHAQHMILEAKREWQEALSMDPENKSAQMYLKMLDYEPSLHE